MNIGGEENYALPFVQYLVGDLLIIHYHLQPRLQIPKEFPWNRTGRDQLTSDESWVPIHNPLDT